MKLYTENMQVNIPIYQESVSASKLDEVNQASSAEKKLSVNSQSDQVNISEEARQKSVDDTNQTAMRKIMGKEDVNEAEGEGQRTLDEKIAELQEKITKLTAELAQERRSGNNEKAKTMESELVMLNSQLLQLIEQKMEAAKSQ
ncbi:hypothetical protein A9Q75_18910 [Colwellia psychrerythraea]|uniref:Uncharacterized protein n=1 Tax=Colwellia psychrerythraea TaxID=28229 RepID=A0A1Y5E2D9_COLPS|nr:hypothetical protein A9Q75_18910 [Colwellia psychrerythraea]